MKNFLLVALLLCTHQWSTAQSIPDTLKVAFTQAPPFIIEADGKLEGINIWLWNKVAQELDIIYELQPMGFREMLEALYDGSIDVSINPLTITSERNKKMNFTHSYYASHSTVVVAKTSSFQQITQFLRSFFNLNFLKGMSILLFIISLFGVAIWSAERRANPQDFRSGWKGIWDGLWWSVVTMTTVGYGDKSPKSRMGKFIALIWMFSGLLFISGLTASVASMLTVDQLKSNPEGFIEYKDAAVGCIKNSSTSEFLEALFFNNIQPYNNVTAGLDALVNQEIDAFLYDEPILKYRIHQNLKFQRLRVLPFQFDLQFYAFGLPEDRLELRDKISQKILEIMESMEWKMVLKEYDLSEI
ncbi:MAG: transporter substrate-binding domain-containing protein [Bacteroidota bacterium]